MHLLTTVQPITQRLVHTIAIVEKIAGVIGPLGFIYILTLLGVLRELIE